MMSQKNKNIGEFLVDKGYLTPANLDAALTVQKDSGNALWDTLIENKLIGEQSIRMALENCPDLPIAHPKAGSVPPETFKLIPLDLCRRYSIFPMDTERNESGELVCITLAAADPEGNEGVERIVAASGRPTKIAAALREDIDAAIAEAESLGLAENHVRQNAMSGKILTEISKDRTAESLLTWILENISDFSNGTLHIKKREDAIHAQDMDGQYIFTLPGFLHEPLLVRLREAAHIPETHEAALQKGHINFPGSKGAAIMFRLSIFLGVDGHEIQLKALPVEAPPRSLSDLGMGARQSLQVRKVLEAPGLTLVISSGPEGLGTTLFSLLHSLQKKGKTITVEDEILYRSPNFLQIETASLSNENISTILKEIKFLEFNKVLFNAATHSHLRDLLALALKNKWVIVGMIEENFKTALEKIASNAASLPLYGLKMLIHQKFIPLLCPDCRIPCALGSVEQHAVFQEFGEASVPYQQGDGCAACGGKGVKGFKAFFEVLPVTSEVRDVFHGKLKGELGLDKIAELTSPSMASQFSAAVNRGEISLSSLWDII